MDKITKIRIKNDNDTYTDPVPIGADAQNVVLSSGFTVEQVIGDVDVGAAGTIRKQLGQIINRLERLQAQVYS